MSSALSTALQVATEAAAAVIARRSHARATGETFAQAALQLSPPSARKYSIATAPIKDMCPTKTEPMQAEWPAAPLPNTALPREVKNGSPERQ